MNFGGGILVGAVALGLVGGVGSKFLAPSTSPAQSAHEQDWTPRNTIAPPTMMSAADLDEQQPSGGTTPDPVQQQEVAATGSGWSYRNCREARAAGAAPLYRGQPGYGAHMDGDNDGIACEPYHGQ
jgi:hypothetical protein